MYCILILLFRNPTLVNAPTHLELCDLLEEDDISSVLPYLKTSVVHQFARKFLIIE